MTDAAKDQNSKKRKRRGERKDGRIQVTLTDGVRPDGKPNRIPFYGRTRDEAERARDKYKQLRAQGLSIDGQKITVNEWMDIWSVKYKIKVDDYKTYIDALKADVGNMTIWEVREINLHESVQRYAGKSKSAATKYMMIVKWVFGKARKNRLIPFDPSEDLDLPEDLTDGSHRAIERWESDTILKFWDVCRAGLWALLMLLCGLRRSEMVGLQWPDVDLEKRQITIRRVGIFSGNKTIIKEKTKTEAGFRVLPICQPLYDALISVPAELRVGYVCKSAHGELITQSAHDRGWDGFLLRMQRVLNGEPVEQHGRRMKLEKRIEKAKEQGKEYVLFSMTDHDLRHSFATALYDAGVDVKSAQYYLGHKDIKMTMALYTHLSKERENRSRASIVGFLDGWLKEAV